MNKLYKNKEWLYQKYIVEKLNTVEISKILNCSYSTIADWLKKHNISKRTRSEAHIVPLKKQLCQKIDIKNNISECWECKNTKDKDGYGHIKINQKYKGIHVVMYEYFYRDKIKKGEIVHHMCENPSCCNPFHLIKMNNKKHTQLHQKGIPKIKLSGENSPNAQFTWDQVNNIRKEYTGKYGEQVKLAKKYNTSSKVIHNIVRNKHWRI